METPMKGNATISRLCFANGTPNNNNNNNSSAANSSPQLKPSSSNAPSPPQSPKATPPSIISATKNGTNNNSTSSPQSSALSRGLSLNGGCFPGPNCKCLISTHIAPFLDEKSLVALMRTCRRMREITTSDDVWEVRLKEMRVGVILVNRTSNFFRAFRSDVVTLRGLEGFYDFESEEGNSHGISIQTGNALLDEFNSTRPVSAIKKVMLHISPAFLGFVTPVARVCLVVQYFGMMQEDVFEGTMRYSFPKRLFVMTTYLTRAPRQEGPRFDVVVARSVRKWGTQKVSHFDSVRGGTRLILSISQSAQPPANGYLPSNELVTVSRKPRDGEGPAPPLPGDGSTAAVSPSVTASNIHSNNSNNNNSSFSALLGRSSNKGDSDSHSDTSSNSSSTSSSSSGSAPPAEKKSFSLRSFLGGMGK